MSTSALLNQLKGAKVTQSAHVAMTSSSAANAKVTQEVPESLKGLPPHILRACPMSKLIMQVPYFDCPEWADRPNPALKAHFAVSRPAAPGSSAQPERLAPLMIDALPYYIFGKSAKLCDHKFEHESISRLHCAVVHHRTGAAFIIDMNSANGVRVNGTRIAQGSYVQLAEGDVVTLGGSTRALTLRMRPPSPRSKPAVPATTFNVDGDPTAAEAKRERDDAPGTSQQQQLQQARPAQPSAETSSATALMPAPTTEGALSSSAAAAPATAAASPAAAGIDVAHILIKHKDTANPVSKAPRNKGEAVTRSREDALRTAAALHAKAFAAPPVSEAAFASLVGQFSECATAKKQGKMGTITRGTLSAEFEEAAFALEPFHVSPPVETPLGVHLIMRLQDPAPSSS